MLFIIRRDDDAEIRFQSESPLSVLLVSGEVLGKSGPGVILLSDPERLFPQPVMIPYAGLRRRGLAKD